MPEEINSNLNIPAAIVCVLCGAKKIVMVEPDFGKLSNGSQITALTPVAEELGFTIWRDPNEKRHFLCADCSGSNRVELGKFEGTPSCRKCGSAEVVYEYSAGAPMISGGHLRYQCKKCKYNWQTKTKDTTNDKPRTKRKVRPIAG